jgi:hypothetical protein
MDETSKIMSTSALLIGGPGDGETVLGVDGGIDTIRRGDDVYTLSRTAGDYFPGFDGPVFLHPTVMVCSQRVRVLLRELELRPDSGEDEIVAKLRREADRHNPTPLSFGSITLNGWAVGTSVLDRREDQEWVDFTLRWLAAPHMAAEAERDGAVFRQ